MRNEKQFIPLTLTDSGKQFYTEWTWIFGFVVLVLFLLAAGGFANIWSVNRYVNILGTIPALVVMEFLNGALWLKILRMFVLKEHILKQIYAETRDNRVTDISVFWGSYSIDGDCILYIDGRCGILISAARGFKDGRPPSFEEVHFDKLSRFLRYLLNERYGIKYYNRMMPDANIEPLKNIERKISRNRTAGIYFLESRTIKFLRELSVDIADTEKEYFLVTCNSIDLIDDMRLCISQALDYLRDSLYTDITICNEKEIYGFIQQFFGISYINVQRLIKNTFQRNSKKMVSVEEVIFADEDQSLREKAIKDANAYRHLEEVAKNATALETFEKMQRDARAAAEEEHRAKLLYALKQRGINIKKLSSRKFKKLAATVTYDELRDADTALNKIRIERIYGNRTEKRVSQGGKVNLKQSGNFSQPRPGNVTVQESASQTLVVREIDLSDIPDDDELI